MDINIRIPVSAVKAAVKLKGVKDKKRTSLKVRATRHIPKSRRTTVKVDLLDMQVLLNIADAHRAEVQRKMTAKYGEEE